MKSPLKNAKCKNLSISFLKKILPANSRIDSYNLFDGAVELSLGNIGHHVRAHTEKKIIYEFWRCVQHNPKLLHRFLTYDGFVFRGENDFFSLQETLPTRKDAYMRSSIFFLLNRCSESGYASHGDYDDRSYNMYALRRLKNFQAPPAFKVFHDSGPMHLEMMKRSDCDYVIVPSLRFSFNLFEHGKSISYDTQTVVHSELKNVLSSSRKNTILIYNFHEELLKYFSDFNIYLIDKYGRICFEKEQCEEIIVTNF